MVVEYIKKYYKARKNKAASQKNSDWCSLASNSMRDFLWINNELYVSVKYKNN